MDESILKSLDLSTEESRDIIKLLAKTPQKQKITNNNKLYEK